MMKVILKHSVEGLGAPGALVSVRDGYARNFLIPRDLAAPATSFNVKNLAHQRQEIERRVAREEAQAISLAERLRTVTVTIRRQVGEGDKMFGSVTSRDVAEALRAEGIDLSHRALNIEAPVKELGVHDIEVRLLHGVKGTFKLLVDRA